MSESTRAEKVLRQIEHDVLDNHHRPADLLARDHTSATLSLLRCFGHVLRDLRTGAIKKPNNDARSQTANEGLRGLAHCLRWAAESCPKTIHVPSASPKTLQEEALALLQWGVRYDPLWNQHSAYSRGLVTATVDEEAAQITFEPKRLIHPRYFCTQAEAKKIDDERQSALYPEAELSRLSHDWFASAATVGERLQFDDDKILSSGAVDVAESWLENTCLPELAATVQLMDCTVGELRRVLAAIHVYSLFRSKFEDLLDEAGGESVSSSVISMKKEDICAWLMRLSGCPSDSIQAILSVLTFDASHPHVTLAQQPFIEFCDGAIAFLPRMLLFLDLPRMYVGALNKSKQGRRVYDHVIVTIEQVGVSAISHEIESAIPGDMEVATGKTFSLGEGQEITPDIVLYSAKERTALVIDVKYATPPFGPADVHHDIEEMAKWKSRVFEYVESLEMMPGILGQHLAHAPTEPLAVSGMILTRWPFPVPFEFGERVVAVDWPSLAAFIQFDRATRLDQVLTWATTRPDVTLPGPLAWKHKTVPAGPWQYSYSVLSAVPSERLVELKRQLAFRLWEERGRPLWDDASDWFEAESLLATNPYVAVERRVDLSF